MLTCFCQDTFGFFLLTEFIYNFICHRKPYNILQSPKYSQVILAHINIGSHIYCYSVHPDIGRVPTVLPYHMSMLIPSVVAASTCTYLKALP